jgi:hypothetical protein
MTTVCGQPVGTDSLGSAKLKSSGKKGGNHAGFLGQGCTLGGPAQVSAGTPGGSVGPGHGGMPKSSAPVLTRIEKPLRSGT